METRQAQRQDAVALAAPHAAPVKKRTVALLGNPNTGNGAIFADGNIVFGATNPDVTLKGSLTFATPDYSGDTENIVLNGNVFLTAWGGTVSLTLSGVNRVVGATWFNVTFGEYLSVWQHEMGHAFQNWESRNQPGVDYLWPTMEAAEINSMGLEFLAYPGIGRLVGEEAADRFRRMHLIGALGDDEAGDRVLHLCKRLRLETGGIWRLRARPTTQKTRIVAHNQQVVRADRESTEPVDGRGMRALTRAVAQLAGSVDGVVISDYGKGLITQSLVAAAVALKPRPVITADPKPQNIDAFRGVDCIAPNAAEAESASGVKQTSDADLGRAARLLMTRTRCRYVLITRGEHGMTLFGRRSEPFTVPAIARQVYDVSGAGDTVIAVLTMALAAGASIEHAVGLATLAAGVVVGKLGTATATALEIQAFAGREGIAKPSRFPARRISHGAQRR